MKDSKKYSPKLTKLFNSLKRKSPKQPMPEYSEPVEAIVFAMIVEAVPEDMGQRYFKRLKKHFVDFNDLRVSRREEVLDVLGDSSEPLENSVKAITRMLNTIFEKTNKMTLKGLTQDGKRQAHKELSEIEGVTPFAVSYCFLTAFGGHAIPLNAAMLDYLRTAELVHPSASDVDIAGFLERQIGAADAYDFYLLLRNEAERENPAAKTTKTVKKEAAAKKTTAKKKTADKKTTAKKKTVTKKKTTVKKKVTAKKKTAKK